MRNSEETRKKLIRAAKELLAKKGFQKIGINSIARKAGVDKVLIYRYFGGLQELLREMAKTSDFWPTLEEMAGGTSEEIKSMDIRKLSSTILKGRIRELRKRPATQEILRWELMERNELTDELHFERESQGDELNNLVPFGTENINGVDIPAVTALIISGITYLILRSKTADTFNGIDLHSESGWKRIEGAIDIMIDIFFNQILEKSDSEEQ